VVVAGLELVAQIGLPTVGLVAPNPLSLEQETSADNALRAVWIAAALLDFSRDVATEVRITEAKIPMIAITTKSSIRVKPFFNFFVNINNKIIIINMYLNYNTLFWILN